MVQSVWGRGRDSPFHALHLKGRSRGKTKQKGMEREGRGDNLWGRAPYLCELHVVEIDST